MKTQSVALAPEPGGAVPAPLAAVTTPAIFLDPQGRIVDANSGAAVMLGYVPQDMIGRSLRDLAMDGWQTAVEVATARVRFGATDTFELALKGRSGRRTLVEMAVRAGTEARLGVTLLWSERRTRRSAAGQESDPDLKRIAYGLLRTQEAERMRVSLELHDEIAPVVIMTKYLIEDAVGRIGSGATVESVEILNRAALRLRDVIAGLSRISTELRPHLLDDLGLLPTLEWFCRGIEESCRDVQVVCQLEVAEAEIPQTLKLDIFRIVQEALNNVVEHAHARRAQVSLKVQGGDLVLMVDDDGEGFDLASASSKRDGGINLGLQSIRKRAEATGGRLLFESHGHRGTRIGAVWPLARWPAEEPAPKA